MLSVNATFRDAFPDACVGILALENVTNVDDDPRLNTRKKALETWLREHFKGLTRSDLLQKEPLRSYVSYYKGFRKTYHVLLQLESIVSGGKDIPRANCLVEAMFMAELKNQILTAGHDRAVLVPPLQASVATGSEELVTMSGKRQVLTAGDMYVRDGDGILSAVLHGPDARTKIGIQTTDVLYVVYAPPGVDRTAVATHLESIRENVAIFSPGTGVAALEVLP
jgi:DNA/RNA-binding domain of Phe-tRNA-synthetase-like protein